MRGYYTRFDGLRVPNNFSLHGAEMVLKAAFQNQVPTLYAALVSGVPTPDMLMGDMLEPMIGTNGYARIAIPRSNVGWPTYAVSGSDAVLTSQWLTWEAVGGGFSTSFQRVALVGSAVYSPTEPVYSLSAPLPSPLVITPTTDLAERRFKYEVVG